MTETRLIFNNLNSCVWADATELNPEQLRPRVSLNSHHLPPILFPLTIAEFQSSSTKIGIGKEWGKILSFLKISVKTKKATGGINFWKLINGKVE